MRRLALTLAAGLLAGCAASRPPPPAVPREGTAVELGATPFHPQKRYQCGPAALATALGASGRPVDPDALAPEVYLPGRRGSLQAELVAAARRYDRVAAPIEGDLSGIVAALRAGQPVLVLLNLGFSWLPVWHYAVVVGYDPADASFVLRSGRTRRKRMGAAALERSWAYSAHWAVVVTALDTPPASSSAAQWLSAVAPLESLGRLDLAATGYTAATLRWPASPLAWTALGNVEARRAHWTQAVQAYSRALAQQDGVVTRNNRASALGALQCRTLAEADLDRAAALDGARRYASVLADTRRELPERDACPATVFALLGAS